MPSLEVQIPGRYNTRNFTLSQQLPQDTDASQVRLRFSGQQALYQGRCTEVYRGILVGPGDLQRDVVCKFVDGNTGSLEYEARLYDTKLAHLQGVDVPKFLGFFRDLNTDPSQTTACILLEHFGRSMTRWLGSYPMDVRMKVVEAVTRVHNAGVMHCDFDERHVLIDANSDIRIIDFDDAGEYHRCQRAFEIEPYEYAPDQIDYNCDELYEIALGAEIWTPTKIMFMGARVSLFTACTEDELTAYGVKHLADGHSEGYIREQAKLVLAKYNERYKDRWDIIDAKLALEEQREP